MDWWKQACDKLLERVAMAMFLLLIFVTLFQVISRYVFPVPISFTEEVGRFLFIWISFLGAAIVMNRDEHIRLDLFHGRVSRRTYDALRMVVYALIVVFSLHFRDGGNPSPSGESLGVVVWSRAKLPEWAAQQI